jgi:hypothetical protein
MEAVKCWRKTILSLCLQKMTHMPLIATTLPAVDAEDQRADGRAELADSFD